MKNILLVNASPRIGGNSDLIVKTLAEKLSDCEVTIFDLREKKCGYCLGCGACQGKTTQNCVQNDDMKALLPIIDKCDGIVIATPIYNQQMTAMAKCFIERWYPFFKFDGKGMSNTSKYGKKGAMICSFWGSDPETVEKYANWTLNGFSQIGVEETKVVIFPQIPQKGDVLKNREYIAELDKLAVWLMK